MSDTPEGHLVVDTEFLGRIIWVYRRDCGNYWCYDNGRCTQEAKPAEAVMGWLANMMMNA
jgi:hypothetical protein